MKQLFKTSDDKIFTFSTNKYNLNSVSFCFTFQVNHNNAAHLSILDEFTKDHLRKNISSTYPISIYTQVLKKDKLFLFLIYFQYPRGLDNYRILNVSYLEIIANNIQKLINLNEKNCSNFEYYKQLAIRKVIAFENDIKTKAIKECFEILEDNYVTLYGQKEKIQDINQGSFIQWFSKSILCQDIQKQAFLLGTYSVLDEILISDSIPDSKRYEPSRNRQKIFESPIYIERNIESKIGFLVIALQVQEYESYSKKAISFLGEYLGGGGFSILFNIVREQKKLVYQIGTTTNVNKGEIIITAKVSKENISQVITIIDEEIFKLQKGIINEAHFLSSTKSFHLNEARSLDRPLTLTRSYINYLTDFRTDDTFSKEEFTRLINKVRKVVTVSFLEV